MIYYNELIYKIFACYFEHFILENSEIFEVKQRLLDKHKVLNSKINSKKLLTLNSIKSKIYPRASNYDKKMFKTIVSSKEMKGKMIYVFIAFKIWKRFAPIFISRLDDALNDDMQFRDTLSSKSDEDDDMENLQNIFKGVSFADCDDLKAESGKLKPNSINSSFKTFRSKSLMESKVISSKLDCEEN